MTIRLQHELDERGEYFSTTAIHVDILVRGEVAGNIQGTLVDRNSIPRRCFYSVMDAHSDDLQYAAVSLFEPRYGRTKLKSLWRKGEDRWFKFLYIGSLHVNEEYTSNGSSDVGAYALRKLLYHPFIKGSDRDDEWQTSSCIHILDSTTQKDKDNAIQFLRNGFFQDRAVVYEGNDRFLVAASGHWKEPLISHAEAAKIPFLEAPPRPPPPTGKDAEIRQIIERAIYVFTSGHGDPSYQAHIVRLVSEGGSLARARALHIACIAEYQSMVEFILRIDPSTLESRDECLKTPLMFAAASASANGNMMGRIARDQPIIDLLLAAGARTDAVDAEGNTAYGNLVKMHNEYHEMLQAKMGLPITSGVSRNIPGLAQLKAKLMPPGGSTAADHGEAIGKRIIKYLEEEDTLEQVLVYPDDRREYYGAD